MKVLHVAPSLAQSYGGPTLSLMGYAAAAAKCGMAVTVAAPDPGEAERETLETKLGGRPLLFSSFGSGAFATSPALVEWVHDNASRYDVVHTHGLFNPISSLSTRAAIRRGAAVIIRPFGTLSRYTFEHRRRALKRAWLAALERSNLRNAAGLHFTTETERNEAAWHGIDFSGRAHVVPPPLDVESSVTQRRPDADPLVFYLGRLNPVKNIEALILAWPEVRGSEPRAQLVVAGDGDGAYRKRLESRATGDSSIRFSGFVSGSEKTDLLSRAAVCVLPSLHENFGMAVVEAIAAGVPVVISPHVQLASVIEEENLGIVVETTPELLAQAIVKTIRDESLRGRVERDGPDTVRRRFSSALTGERLEKMYDAAVTRRTQHNNRKQAS